MVGALGLRMPDQAASWSGWQGVVSGGGTCKTGGPAWVERASSSASDRGSLYQRLLDSSQTLRHSRPSARPAVAQAVRSTQRGSCWACKQPACH